MHKDSCSARFYAQFQEPQTRTKEFPGTVLAATAMLLLHSACTVDLRGDRITAPHYKNPLEELDLEAPNDQAELQLPSQSSSRPTGGNRDQARQLAPIDLDLDEIETSLAGEESLQQQHAVLPDTEANSSDEFDEIDRIATLALENANAPASGQSTSSQELTTKDKTLDWTEQVDELLMSDDELPPPPSTDEPLADAQAEVELPDSPTLSDFRTEETRTRLQMPVTGEIVRGYSSERGGNEGIDIAAPPGTEVVAAEDGEIALISRTVDETAIVLIRHDGNLYTVYSNLASVELSKGDRVSRGVRIGTIAEGDRQFLHFEVRIGTEHTDPIPFIS